MIAGAITEFTFVNSLKVNIVEKGQSRPVKDSGICWRT